MQMMEFLYEDKNLARTEKCRKEKMLMKISCPEVSPSWGEYFA